MVTEQKKIFILNNSTFADYKHKNEVIKELCKHYKVYVCSPNLGFESELKSFGCELIDIKMKGRGTNIIEELEILKQYNKIVKRFRPDIILTFSIKPNIYASIIAKKYKIPYLNSVTGVGKVFQSNSVLNNIIKILYRFALNKTSMVFFENIENKEKFIENKIINENVNVKLIPGSGVNLDKYSYSPIKKNNSGEIKLLFIGRVMKEKGIEELIEASKIISKKNPKIKCYVIGDLVEDYKYEIMKSPIIYLGLQEDVRKYIIDSDIIVHPSYHEGMSNVLLEAAAIGRPLLASNIHGCKEIVINNYNGFLFESKSVESLTESIEKIISINYEDRLEMGKKSRKHVEKNFDKKIVIKEYLDAVRKYIK